MTQIIEIEGGLVRVVNKNIEYQTSLEEWLPRIERRTPRSTPVLPVGVRAMHWDDTDLSNQKLAVLIEQQPQIIRMSYDADRTDYPEVLELSIPYTRFFFVATSSDTTSNLAWTLHNYRVFWSKNQYVDHAKRDMIQALLPNVYEDGRICFGSTAAEADQSLAQRLNQTVNEFWVSTFNNDLTIRRPNNWRSYRPWVRMTQNDPTGWMEWPDLDPDQSYHQMYSYEQLTASVGFSSDSRFAPMVAADPIAPVPLAASIGRINEWLDHFTPTQRSRMLEAMLRDRALHNERYEEALVGDDADDE